MQVFACSVHASRYFSGMLSQSPGAALDQLKALEQMYRDLISDMELAPGEAEALIQRERAANPHLRDLSTAAPVAPAPEIDRW